MLLRNSSGAFQVYNISNNQLTGSLTIGGPVLIGSSSVSVISVVCRAKRT
jgi:hypothetical protein